MIGFIASKSRRAELNQPAVVQRLVVTRYDPVRAAKDEMLSLDDIGELLGLPLIGVIPESKTVLTSTNIGVPVINVGNDDAAEAYKDMVDRFLGTTLPFRFTTVQADGLFTRVWKAARG